MDLGSALRHKIKTEYYNRPNAMIHPNTGVPHTLCFIDEVLDHEFPEGFKPVNIEAYDREHRPWGPD